MAHCPSCGFVLAIDATSCKQCRATFGPGSAWHPLPDSADELESLKKLHPDAVFEKFSEPKPQGSGFARLVIYLGMLLLWIFPAGFLTIGVRFSLQTNIIGVEATAIQMLLVVWLALPFTSAAMVFSSKNGSRGRGFLINVALWVALLTLVMVFDSVLNKS